MVLSLLVSQVGYRPEDPKAVVVRGGTDDRPPGTVAIEHADGTRVVEVPLGPATSVWGATYWPADITSLRDPGRYAAVLPGGERSNEFDIEDDVLLRRTLCATSVETLEARVRGKLGWQDCAFDGRGLESHAVVVLGLADVLTSLADLEPEIVSRMRQQLLHGADYLVACQRDDGSFMNELYIARDRTTWTLCGLACVALARAAEILSSGELLDRAKRGWSWITEHDSTVGRTTDLETTRRIFGQYAPWTPPEAPRARDLLLLLRAATELYRNTNDLTYVEAAAALARTIDDEHQCRTPSPPDGLYGDFWAWPGTGIHQRAWEHAGWDYNCGAVLPDDVSGFLSLIELAPDHPDVPRWRAVLHHYAYGHLLPASRLTPFGIHPLGNCEGEVRFFGPSWHGFNGVYGQVARTGMLLARHLGDPRFEELALRNLHWVAGANAGVDTGGGVYQGLSWISGIGERSTEVWSGIPGSVGNGFCANRQFRIHHLDDAPDAPAFVNDEDWLVHNGSWLSGLAETSTRPRVKVRVRDAGAAVPADVCLTLGDEAFEGRPNARGVVVLDGLPRLRRGTVEVRAGERRLSLPVAPVSGGSVDVVVDLAETVEAAWSGDGPGAPRLLVRNLGDAAATVRIDLCAIAGEMSTHSETRSVDPDGSVDVDLPEALLPAPGRPCWVRAVVTGAFSVATAETSWTS